MAAPFALYDRPTDTRTQRILTEQESGIPGLRMIGRNLAYQAAAPLDDHFHPDCFEFSYLVQGNILFRVAGQDYPLSGGDVFVTFPDEVHSTGSIPLSLHKMYWLQLEASSPEHFLFLDPQAAAWMIAQLRQLPARVVKLDKNATLVFRLLFANLEEGGQAGRYQAAALLQSLLCQILKAASRQQPRLTPDIAQAREYILAHLDQPLPLEELAAQSLLSLSRFKQKFKDQVGTGPRNFINYHKIELAKTMLLQGTSATDVAMDLGFSGSDYFSVVFRRYTSLSPSEYKAQQQNTGAHQI